MLGNELYKGKAFYSKILTKAHRLVAAAFLHLKPGSLQ